MDRRSRNTVYENGFHKERVRVLLICFFIITVALIGGSFIAGEWNRDDSPPKTILPENCAEVVVAHHNYTSLMWTGKAYMTIQHSDPIYKVICAEKQPDVEE